MEKARYMISDAANRIQVESHVLRYWEEELELDVPRNEMGHRYYTEENLRQFEEIKKLKEEGYQLKAIKMLIHSPQVEEWTIDIEEDEPGDTCRREVQEDETEEKEMPAAGDTKVSEGEHPVAAANPSLSKLEQFQLMMSDIVRNAIAENNQALSREIGSQVGDRVLKEMNYLMREREEQEEERYRKLDEAIRSRQRMSRRERVSKRKEKSGKVRMRTRESVS